MNEPTSAEIVGVRFVRWVPTKEEPNGWWVVWIGSTCYGWVRKVSNPVDYRKPWGYSSKSTARRPSGVMAGGGYPTRKAAAQGLIERVAHEGGLIANFLLRPWEVTNDEPPHSGASAGGPNDG